MKSAHLKHLIRNKREWSEPLSPDNLKQGFKGWYSSKYLPHFDAPGVRQFVTYRLADALPVSRRHEWEAFLALEDDLEKQKKIEAYVDRGHGECHLRDARIASLVQDNLWHHDGVKYRLLAWVVMPNHMHLLFEIWQVPLRIILKDMKGFTARRANQTLGRKGIFWEDDYFDRYIRDEEHFWKTVRYIENNPVKAGLASKAEGWPWSSARFRSRENNVATGLVHPKAGRISPKT